MPRSACTRFSSAMISALVLTSSAVEGSSAISKLGIAREGGGEGDPLAHAARELERQAVQHALSLDADLRQTAPHLGGPPTPLGRGASRR